MQATTILALLLLSAAPSRAPLGPLLQPILDNVARTYECGVGVGVRLSDGTALSLASGSTDGKARLARPSDRWVWGSVTKLLTGASVLRLVEEGRLALNDTIVSHVDPILAAQRAAAPSAMNFSSLAELYGDAVNAVTVEQCARMQSGIPDYDTAKPDESPPTDAFRAEVYADPTRDWSPFELISLPWVRTGALDFPPGSRTSYSSTNFVILGILLAAVNGTGAPGTAWENFSQGDAALPNTTLYPSLRFGVTGAPARYTNVSGFDRTPFNGQDPSARPGVDVSAAHGVFGGWTASDVVGDVQDIANFAFDLFGSQVVVEPRYVSMMVPKNDRVFYSFATFNLDWETGHGHHSPAHRERLRLRSDAAAVPDYSIAYGHLGATYGFGASTCFCSFSFFSLLCVVMSLIIQISKIL